MTSTETPMEPRLQQSSVAAVAVTLRDTTDRGHRLPAHHAVHWALRRDDPVTTVLRGTPPHFSTPLVVTASGWSATAGVRVPRWVVQGGVRQLCIRNAT